MSTAPSRRDVLKLTAGAAAGLALSPMAFAQSPRKPKPNDRIRFAIIGVGGKGWSNREAAAASGDIVALCDIDAQTRSKGSLEHPEAATFSDFRQMFDAMSDDIDAVVISTPDHTHAPAAALAIRYGKHVYVEKPLTRTIHEARVLAKLARERRVASQMGNQFTAHPEMQRVAAIVRTGALGAVKAVHCWTNRSGGWWPQGVARPESKPKPKHVNWDAWLGPAPERAYADGYHPFAWRGWWDFGSGSLGDIGCHCMNLPFLALDLRDPFAVLADTTGHNGDSFPSQSTVTYEFGARGGRGPLSLTWYDGGRKPDPKLAPGIELGDNGSILVCEGGTLVTFGEYGTGGRLVGGAPLPKVEIEESPGHFAEFVRAIMGGKLAGSDIPTVSAALTETVLLGNLAVWASGRRLEWDARAMRVMDAPELDGVIRPPYRKGWEL